jgi:hypothetical protein
VAAGDLGGYRAGVTEAESTVIPVDVPSWWRPTHLLSGDLAFSLRLLPVSWVLLSWHTDDDGPGWAAVLSATAAAALLSVAVRRAAGLGATPIQSSVAYALATGRPVRHGSTAPADAEARRRVGRARLERWTTLGVAVLLAALWVWGLAATPATLVPLLTVATLVVAAERWVVLRGLRDARRWLGARGPGAGGTVGVPAGTPPGR